MEHGALRRLPERRWGGLSGGERRTNCINCNWQQCDRINFTNSDVSPRAGVGPALPKLSVGQFHSVSGTTLEGCWGQ